MTRKVVALKRKAVKALTLGPGLHAGTIELKAGRSYRVRTFSGAEVAAELDARVEPAFADECLRDGRAVLLADTPRGPVIVGAVQTTRAVSCSADGSLAIAAKDIKLTADRSLRIEAGPVALTVDPAGILRVEGDRMVIDMGALIRLLAARVELP